MQYKIKPLSISKLAASQMVRVSKSVVSRDGSFHRSK